MISGLSLIIALLDDGHSVAKPVYEVDLIDDQDDYNQVYHLIDQRSVAFDIVFIIGLTWILRDCATLVKL